MTLTNKCKSYETRQKGSKKERMAESSVAHDVSVTYSEMKTNYV